MRNKFDIKTSWGDMELQILLFTSKFLLNYGYHFTQNITNLVECSNTSPKNIVNVPLCVCIALQWFRSDRIWIIRFSAWKIQDWKILFLHNSFYFQNIFHLLLYSYYSKYHIFTQNKEPLKTCLWINFKSEIFNVLS